MFFSKPPCFCSCIPKSSSFDVVCFCVSVFIICFLFFSVSSTCFSSWFSVFISIGNFFFLNFFSVVYCTIFLFCSHWSARNTSTSCIFVASIISWTVVFSFSAGSTFLSNGCSVSMIFFKSILKKDKEEVIKPLVNFFCRRLPRETPCRSRHRHCSCCRSRHGQQAKSYYFLADKKLYYFVFLLVNFLVFCRKYTLLSL